MTDVPDARRKEHPLQDVLARWLGVPVDGRSAIVREMFARHRLDAVSYWLQIVLATGIATLGLVLSSTGIVIGAMLISPLMSPIVGLGMGLAAGAPLLTLRSALRVVASIVVVVGMAALLTITLPFHETTTEIAARTSPTVLDLVVAAFCALAAGFTTARQSADTTSTAAGTAIGISLVPPLCVAGYGIGVDQWPISGGALLLFTANFCAIIFCSTLLFVALGFNHVVVEEGAVDGLGARFARRVSAAFGVRYGLVWRLVLPTLLLASVYVPLRAALGEVAWKIQVRDAVTRILRELAPEDRSVRTTLVVEPNTVRIHLALIGSPEDARAVEEALRVRVAAASGLEPVVDVAAVPDDQALRRVASAAAAPLPVPAPVAPALRPSSLRQPIDDALAAHWPAAAGVVRRWQLEYDEHGATVVVIHHQGPAIGEIAEALLADFLRAALGEAIRVRTRPLATGSWEAPAGGPSVEFVQQLARGLAAAREAPELRACVTRGAPPADEAATTLASTADVLLASLPAPNVEVRDGAAWAIDLLAGACPAAPTAAPERPADAAGQRGDQPAE
ncbi:MAG: DUF389 domain-containing protein [Myxococcales bacterium]|nr:DUF389 domain-containing protein [Myxococcales bacterium]